MNVSCFLTFVQEHSEEWAMDRIDRDNASTVREVFEAFRDRRKQDMDDILAPNFTFTSPYDNAIDRNEFFRRCWPNGDNLEEFRIERITPDIDGAFITYLFLAKDGRSFRNTEYLRVLDGLVMSVHVYFGESYRDGVFTAKTPE